MAEEPDGMNEAIDGNLVLGLTMATRAAEQLAQIVAARAREAAAADAAQGRELQARLSAERSAAKASVMGVNSEAWWKRAKPEEIAAAWQTTQTWRVQDPYLAAAGDRIRDEVHERYGVDMNDLRADPAALREALAERGISQDQPAAPRREAGREGVEAAVLIGEADAADRRSAPALSSQSDAETEVGYDTPARREAMAERLGKVAEPDVVQARVLADTAQAQPASAAVSTPPTAGRGARPVTAQNVERDRALSR